MARLASTAKAHFYPINPAVTNWLTRTLSAPHGGRILDPTAGEGVALRDLARVTALEPFGSELSLSRATKAQQTISDWLTTRDPSTLPRTPTQKTSVSSAPPSNG